MTRLSRILALRSLRDSWLLMASCCALLVGFVALRVWVSSKIKFDAFVKLFTEALKIFQSLLPVPIEDLASPLGRAAFSYEELPVILVLGLWTVSRGSDCIAGRLASGTMEMLLAQPVRRATLVTSHTAVTLVGVAALSAASLGGLALGLAVSEYGSAPRLAQLWPATANFFALGLFLAGLATFASAVCRTRAQAVAAIIAFYVIELALMIVGRLAPEAKWLERLTILSAYEPTLLTLGLDRDPATHWPLFWQYNAWLVGLGLLLWLAAAVRFCRRDVPAPL
ncbi:MAG TPA: ABC transporter permease subunit [Lacipirellulaceae bacterium]|nr:ABC transporter permease subunit [Lacipirellulaceae bacterium]